MPSDIRRRLYPLVMHSLKPEGIILLESYSKSQLARNTGGPKDPDLLLTAQDIVKEFPDSEVILCQETEREIVEGGVPHRLVFRCAIHWKKKRFIRTGAVMFDHEKHMRRAIELAANVPDFPFGAVIVDGESGEIIAEGCNKSSINPTWHGEIDAINHMVESGYDFQGKSLVLYTTAEPCPMCQGAIQWTGIETVVFGTSIRFLQQLGWKQIDISAHEIAQRTPFSKCTLIGGILEDQCNSLFESASGKNRK